MKNKGFALIGVLIGLFFLGLISVLSFPLLTSSYVNYETISNLTEMNYLGESIYERLCAKDVYSRELINELGSQSEVVFLDLEDYYLEKYKVIVVNLNKYENYIDVKILVQSTSEGGNLVDVEFKGSILK